MKSPLLESWQNFLNVDKDKEDNMGDVCNTVQLRHITVQENGIIRDSDGGIIGRLSDSIDFSNINDDGKPALSGFKIKISDGHCEYEYPLEIGGDNSIDSVYNKICEVFGAVVYDGRNVNEIKD